MVSLKTSAESSGFDEWTTRHICEIHPRKAGSHPKILEGKSHWNIYWYLYKAKQIKKIKALGTSIHMQNYGK